MTFKLFGYEWDLIALTIFMFVMMPLAQICKPLLRKIKIFAKWMDSGDWFGLILSWLAGALTYYFVIHTLWKIKITPTSIIQYAFFTLLLNGGYKGITKLFKLIKKLKDLEKPNGPK